MEVISGLRLFFSLFLPQYLILIFATVFSSYIIINKILPVDVWMLLFICAVLSLCVFGLNSLNHIYDLPIDKISKPNRPLPSGQLTVKQVFLIAYSLFICALILSILVNYIFTFLILLFIILSILYSTPPIRFKKYWFSHNILGPIFYTVIPFLSSWLISYPTPFPVIIFMFFTTFMAIIASTKDFEDIAGDKAAGIFTLPVRFGAVVAFRIITFLIIGCFLSILILIFLSFLPFQLIYAILSSFILLFFISFFASKLLLKMGKETVTSESRIATYYKIYIVLVYFLFAVFALFP